MLTLLAGESLTHRGGFTQNKVRNLNCRGRGSNPQKIHKSENAIFPVVVLQNCSGTTQLEKCIPKADSIKMSTLEIN